MQHHTITQLFRASQSRDLPHAIVLHLHSLISKNTLVVKSYIQLPPAAPGRRNDRTGRAPQDTRLHGGTTGPSTAEAGAAAREPHGCPKALSATERDLQTRHVWIGLGILCQGSSYLLVNMAGKCYIWTSWCIWAMLMAVKAMHTHCRAACAHFVTSAWANCLQASDKHFGSFDTVWINPYRTYPWKTTTLLLAEALRSAFPWLYQRLSKALIHCRASWG